MEKRILRAAEQYFKDYLIWKGIKVIFEHGQYWVTFYDKVDETDRTFSVVEAIGSSAIDGFDFEEV